MNELKDGIYPLMNREDYDAVDRTRWSWIKELKKTPAHYLFRTMQKREDTDALTLGDATHIGTLEPEKYQRRYAIWDGFRRAGNEWKKFSAQAEGMGKTILTEDMHEKAQALVSAVRNNPLAIPYLSGGKGELALLWTAEDVNGADVQIKSRLDFVSDAGAIVDLKTCRSAKPMNFEKAAWDYGYFEQAAMYQDAYLYLTGKRLPYVILAVESSPPYVMTRFFLEDVDLNRARDSYRALLWHLVECRRTNHYPGYATETVPLKPPHWALQPANDDDPSGMGLTFEVSQDVKAFLGE